MGSPLTFRYILLRVPGNFEEFIEKAARDHSRIIISHMTEQSEVQPERNVSPYLSYKIFLILQSRPTDRKSNNAKGGRKFKLELESDTKTQFPDADPILHETLDAVQRELPEIIELCKKYNVPYSLDEKTNDLLLSRSGL